jgi:hypothetical protein
MLAGAAGLGAAVLALPQQGEPVDKSQFFQTVLAHQHADDDTLEQFERTEHRQLFEHGSDTVAQTDTISRLVPTGAGWAHILLSDHGKPVDEAALHREMADVERSLQDAVTGTSYDARSEKEKVQRRNSDRAETLDAIIHAFTFTRVGNETINGRITTKYRLDPDPYYKPHTRTTEFLKHCNGTLWLDETAGQVARVDANVISDVSIGGILAKVYRGGRIYFEQSEVAPGIWFPTYYQADFTGRKLFVLFEVHEKMSTYNYRRVGGPADSLAMIRREMAGDPPH